MADAEPQDESAPREAPASRPSAAEERNPKRAPRGDSAAPKRIHQRDSDRRPAAKRDGRRSTGERNPSARRDGEPRATDRTQGGRRDGKRGPSTSSGDHRGQRTPRPGSRPRAGEGRTPVRAPRADGQIERVPRPRHDDPAIPADVTARDLHPAARNQLKTLSKENAEQVARHLAMVAALIDDDPALAHQHALSAERRAGRIAVVRETLAITAYKTGDFARALRELRTYRRLSGSDDQIALIVDSERGVGRPDRALEVGRAVDRAALPAGVRVGLAVAMSGAQLDLGDPERALQELDIPELDPDRAFEWSPALFDARATVLEDLGRAEEAVLWRERALRATEALDTAAGLGADDVIFVDDLDEETREGS